MEFELLGWPPDAPTLALDHERFAYAGKFRMSTTGKAVGRAPEPEAPKIGATAGEQPPILTAAAFNADRTDDAVLWVRYITVRRDRRGEGLGPRLLRFVADRADARGFTETRIAVNNPYAYEAAYRAGFAYTGEETGLAELVCSTAADRDVATYREGMEIYADREDAAAGFAADRLEGTPPEVLD